VIEVSRLKDLKAAELFLGFRIGAVAFFMALIPFCLGLSLESRFQIDQPLFFVAGGALTGAVLVLPRVYFLGGGGVFKSVRRFISRALLG
jgi:hypothetical protein